jgi:hypothetical protein
MTQASDRRPPGTMVKVALWLKDSVGEGAVFTKADLRAEFPTVSQVDRRMRDLRDHRWVIWTNKEDASLAPNELRLQHIGDAVWRGDVRRRPAGVSSKTRRSLLADADFMCRVCGVAGGMPFPDDPRVSASLGVSTVSLEEGASTDRAAVVLCQKCAGFAKDGRDIALARVKLNELLEAFSREDREVYERLLHESGPSTNLDRALTLGRRLTHFERVILD